MPNTKFLAIIIGASDWPKSNGRWKPFSGFKNSAEGMRDYLKSNKGLGIESENVLYLFDDDRSASEIDEEISHFLEDHDREREASPTDIIFYYVGHGAFTQGDQRYSLAVRSTRIEALGQSGYRVSSLAQTLNRKAPDARKFIIFDSCFAAAGTEEFIPQSDAAFRMEDQAMDEFVESGTALLCAASADMQALAPARGQFTMFSEALLSSLESGSPKNRDQELLSLDHIAQMIRRYVREKYRENAVKPELHVPDQRRGNLSSHPIFPNAAYNELGISSTETHVITNPVEISTESQEIQEVEKNSSNSAIYRSGRLSIISILLLAFSSISQGAAFKFLSQFGASIIIYISLLLCGIIALLVYIFGKSPQWRSLNFKNSKPLIAGCVLLFVIPSYSSQTALSYVALGDAFIFKSVFPGLIILQTIFWRYVSNDWIDRKDVATISGAAAIFVGLYISFSLVSYGPALLGLMLLFVEGLSIYVAVKILNRIVMKQESVTEPIAIFGIVSGILLITFGPFFGAPWEVLTEFSLPEFLIILAASTTLWGIIMMSSLNLLSGRFEDYYISYAFMPLFSTTLGFVVFGEIIDVGGIILVSGCLVLGVTVILRARQAHSGDR